MGLRSPYLQELRKVTADATARRNQQDRDDQARLVSSLGGTIVSTEDALGEILNRDNAVTLLAGTHGGVLITKENAKVNGVPGAIINRLVIVDTVDDITHFANIHFQCLTADRDNAAALVQIKAGSTAIFNNCVFELGGVEMVAMIDVVALGKAHFYGCSFIGVQTAGNPISNAGVAGNVSITGCSNKTAQAHLNATVISETT